MKQIKAFARLCGTTEKTLRFYDRLGLLSPAHTDPVSGYRHYKDEQQAEFALITHYKEMGFTLEQIRTSLLSADRAQMLEALRAQEQALGQAQKRCQQEIELLGKADALAARLLRFDRENRVILWQGDAVRVFSVAPEAMETCCLVLGSLFAGEFTGEMRLSVADIPQSVQDRKVLATELSGEIEALLAHPTLFGEESGKITTVMFYLECGDGMNPEDIDRLSGHIGDLCDREAVLIWGAAFLSSEIEPGTARVRVIGLSEP